MFSLPRWLWLNHVPAGLVLTPEQRLEMRRRVRAMHSGKLVSQTGEASIGKVVLMRIVPGTLILSLGYTVGVIWLGKAKLPAARLAVALPVGIILFQALTWCMIAWSINRAMAPTVWRALNQIGFRVCEKCGYILEYLPLAESKCPECGTPLHPPVRAASAVKMDAT